MTDYKEELSKLSLDDLLDEYYMYGFVEGAKAYGAGDDDLYGYRDEEVMKRIYDLDGPAYEAEIKERIRSKE
jgi:hypothetical protein